MQLSPKVGGRKICVLFVFLYIERIIFLLTKFPFHRD